jgi:2-polyprenyl-6-methoxyphenol hydroxylase-like FAD-dependent oxidoreductase
MTHGYDAIIVGARCAGSPAAMLLARKGYRVLLVDSATFPSDTLSTHVVHPRPADALRRWGLLERLVASSCPPMHTYSFDFGPFAIEGTPRTPELPLSFCPRRTVLDKLLLDGAVEAGVEVREGFTVQRLLMEDGAVVGIEGRTRGGACVTERARIVIGADGRHSFVAEAVGAPRYHARPPLMAAYYAYFSGLPMRGRFETYIRERRGFAAMETHDGLTVVVSGYPYGEFESVKADIEAHFRASIELAPHFAERFRQTRRETKFYGASLPNFFRKPYGPGWALIGDAGYTKDAITAQGILDAFRDAEACAEALDVAFSGSCSVDEALRAFQAARDHEVFPMYEHTCQLAALEPPPLEQRRLLGAVARSRQAMDDFVRMSAGTISPARFFSPENLAAILGGAPAHDAAARGAA